MSRSSVSSRDAPHERAAEIPLTLRRGAQRDPGWQRLRLPLASTGSVGSYCTTSRVARHVSSPTITVFGRAPVWKPRGGVHDVARHHRLAECRACVERDEGVARVDGDPQLPVTSAPSCAVAYGECSANRALGVIPECCRGPEHAHHCVADELLDHAAERLDLTAHTLVVIPEQRTDILGVESSRTSVESTTSTNSHRDDTALLAERRHGASNGEPQAKQNWAASGLRWLHEGQLSMRKRTGGPRVRTVQDGGSRAAPGRPSADQGALPPGAGGGAGDATGGRNGRRRGGLVRRRHRTGTRRGGPSPCDRRLRRARLFRRHAAGGARRLRRRHVARRRDKPWANRRRLRPRRRATWTSEGPSVSGRTRAYRSGSPRSG